MKKYLSYNFYNENKNCIKELDDGFILIGSNNYLFELNLHDKIYECKIVKELDNTISDINELPDKRIILITKEKIFILKRENEEYIIKEEFKMKNDWKMEKLSNSRRDNFNQYFSSEVISNNRLLLKSFSNIF